MTTNQDYANELHTHYYIYAQIGYLEIIGSQELLDIFV